MQCGWLWPHVVNQKQTANTLGVSAMKFYERQQFPSGFFSNSRLHAYIWGKTASVSNPPRVALVSPKCHNIGFHLSVTRVQWNCWADMLDKYGITGLEGLADEPLLSVEDPQKRYQSNVARRTLRLKQTILQEQINTGCNANRGWRCKNEAIHFHLPLSCPPNCSTQSLRLWQISDAGHYGDDPLTSLVFTEDSKPSRNNYSHFVWIHMGAILDTNLLTVTLTTEDQ